MFFKKFDGNSLYNSRSINRIKFTSIVDNRIFTPPKDKKKEPKKWEYRCDDNFIDTLNEALGYSIKPRQIKNGTKYFEIISEVLPDEIQTVLKMTTCLESAFKMYFRDKKLNTLNKD